MMLEDHPHHLADTRRFGCTANEIGCEPHGRVLLKFDDRDHIGQLGTGHPHLMIDGKSGQPGTPRHRARHQFVAAAIGTDRLRRVLDALARSAMQKNQLAPLAALPERAIEIIEPRENPKRHRHDADHRRPMRRGKAALRQRLVASRRRNVLEAGAMEIVRAGAALGAEVRGIDLRQPLDDDTVHSLEAALVEHQVLFFRGQAIDHRQHLAFARRFGPIQTHPGYPHAEGFPEVTILESDRDHPSKIEKWHTDMTFRQHPPLGSILHAIVIPDGHGDTLWMSLFAALDALPANLREQLEGRLAEHSFEHGFRESLAEAGGRERLAQALLDNPPVQHPVIRTHPISGRRGLFINSLFTTRILGLEQTQSDELLALIFEHIERPEFQVRFRWQEDSIAFWDNRSTQHVPVNDWWPERRRHERVTIDGDRPF